MMKVSFLLLSATALWIAEAVPAAADLIGTQVTGSYFGGPDLSFRNNLFDPVNGDVPPGFGTANVAPHGPNNVVITASEQEFGFQILDPSIPAPAVVIAD